MQNKNTKRKHSNKHKQNKRKTYKGGFDWSKNKTKQSKRKEEKEPKEKMVKETRESKKKNKPV